MSDIGGHLDFNLWMTLKRKNSYSNVISVPKLVENEVLHYRLGQLCQKLKNQYDNVYFSGHLGFGSHFK